MDEDIESRKEFPTFINNVVKQLLDLKADFGVIDDLHDKIEQMNLVLTSDISNFSNQLKTFLNNITSNVCDIKNTFNEKYNEYLKKEDTSNKCKSSLDISISDNDCSESDKPAKENTEKLVNTKKLVSLKQKSNDSDSDSSIKRKTRKKRWKRTISKSESESDKNEITTSEKCSTECVPQIEINVYSDKASNSKDVKSADNINKDNESDKENSKISNLKSKDCTNLKKKSCTDSDSDSIKEFESSNIVKKCTDFNKEKANGNISKNSNINIEKTNCFGNSDSDSYTEDPNLIFENSKKKIQEQKRTKLKNKNNDTDSAKKLEKCKNSKKEAIGYDKKSKLDSSCKEINDEDNSEKEKYDFKINSDSNDDSSNSLNLDVMSDIKENDKTKDADVNESEEKPKIGLIKCIDINKLLDPNVKKSKTDSTSPACSYRKVNKLVPVSDSVIILSSSDSELEIRKSKSYASDKKCKNDSQKKGSETTEAEKHKSSDKKRIRDNTKQITSKLFKQLKSTRERRARNSSNCDRKSSSLDKESSTSDSDVPILQIIHNRTHRKANKTHLHEISLTKLNYNYKDDIKLKSECFVSLSRISEDKLKVSFLQKQEDLEINRLTNMKTLKRAHQQNESSSSENDVKSIKKRSKVRNRKVSDGEELTEHSDNDTNIFDESTTKLNTEMDNKDQEPSIPENLLYSDDDSKEKSDLSENEDDKIEKSKDRGNAKKDKDYSKKDDKKKDKDDDFEKENAKKVKDQKKEDKEKNKWRNDSVLRGKLSGTDSDEDFIFFRNKKCKMESEVRSEPEEGTVIPKRSKTKKHLKRIVRRFGSDLSSSSQDEKESKKSDSAKENSESSESDEDTKKKKVVRRRIKRIKDSDESNDGENDDKKKKEEEQSTRKKIRHVWSKNSLADSTREAAKEEEERKKRIAERQKLYNDIYVSNDVNAKVDKVVLDFDEESKEELLSVHPDLVQKLKPHQAQGVQFMWTACFESLERANKTEGSGCILAHCMGLGKTLQVISLIHTLLSNSDKTNIKTVLVVCPLSTVLNWVNEFKKWLDDLDTEQVNVFDLVHYKQNYERLCQLKDWMKFGGVLIIGYDMFRNLSNPKGKRMSKMLVNGFNKVLVEPGPDLVVCDEGHLLKNEKTGISIAMNRLKTKRRIVLTGTPLQNNLKEYFCMVQFVKPNLLGTYKEYLNRFVNPITNGQYTDSTLHDIQIMRKRAHVLHKMLDAIVERRDYNVLAPFLPPKQEYVLFVSLTKVQVDLYREYLQKFSRNTNVKGTSYLFQDFQELQRICIHPRVLLDKSKQDKLRREMEDDDSEGSLKDFINDDESDKSTTPGETSSESDSDARKKSTPATSRRTRANPGNVEEEEPEIERRDEEWWSKYCQGDELDNICHSSKITLLFDILHQCELIGDKVLVFSQSLYSLNLIEYFLARVDEATQNGDNESLEKVGSHAGTWDLGLDYFRMDGSTSCENRSTWCKTFNNEANTRARLFLISTRAGGLGINLVAANRVIIFDVSWNPSYDIQSIYRVYRFGQTKPCYVYRFVTLGTMENKIYERQVTKQAISKRVIDEQQIDRHYNQNDLAELYAFNPVPDEERPTPLVPKDRLFADLLQSHARHIFKYHEHNSLLEDKADEGLNEEERQAAWEEFENEKTAPKFNLMQTMVRNGMFETLRILVQQDNSGWTPAQVNGALPQIVQKISEQVARGDYSMYRRVEEKHEMRVLEQRRMQMIYQQYMQQLRNASGGAPMTQADMNKLAQMFSGYNQTIAAQQHQMPTQHEQMAGGSSSAVSFHQLDPPPQMVPRPHPAVNEVVELND